MMKKGCEQAVSVQATANAGYQFANFSATVGTRIVAGPTVLVALTLTNTGLGTANNTTITSITAISDVAGSGAVTVASGVPVNLGTINSGSSATATVTFNWVDWWLGVRFQRRAQSDADDSGAGVADRGTSG